LIGEAASVPASTPMPPTDGPISTIAGGRAMPRARLPTGAGCRRIVSIDAKLKNCGCEVPIAAAVIGKTTLGPPSCNRRHDRPGKLTRSRGRLGFAGCVGSDHGAVRDPADETADRANCSGRSALMIFQNL
jgi:hypothetical protein